MKVAVLHTRLSGYFAASLRALKKLHDVDLMVYAWPKQPNAPFNPEDFHIPAEIHNREQLNDVQIAGQVALFAPDALLVSGWADRGYLKACHRLRKRLGIPVIAGCDTQFSGSWRQRLGALVAPYYLHRSIDVIWTAGARQKRLACALGYPEHRIWEGYYTCDRDLFASQSSSDHRREFVFTGRCVESKGVLILAEAYKRYRATVENPWPLKVFGVGPLESVLRDAGATCEGFLQPSELPQAMAKASVLILPSLYEPWGVVIHEASSSGLGLVCSTACGATDHLLAPGRNGFLVEPGVVQSLVDALIGFHHMDSATLGRVRQCSIELSTQYTPDKWADTVHAGVLNLQRDPQLDITMPDTSFV